MRRAVLAGLTILTIALVTPLSVLAGALLGFAPTHWSGTALVDVEIPGIIPSGDSRSDAAAFLLDRAQRQDESDRGDLAPSWWDDDAGEVVLGAVTDRGEQMRRELNAGLAPPYRIERRAHSSRELQEVMDRAIELPEYGVNSSGIDPVHNRVRLDVNRLSHGLFSTLHARYGDAVGVVHAPLTPLVSNRSEETSATGEPLPDQPSQWSRADPLGTWVTLTTGFPWYLGTIVITAGGFWVLPIILRRPAKVTLTANDH